MFREPVSQCPGATFLAVLETRQECLHVCHEGRLNHFTKRENAAMKEHMRACGSERSLLSEAATLVHIVPVDIAWPTFAIPFVLNALENAQNSVLKCCRSLCQPCPDMNAT